MVPVNAIQEPCVLAPVEGRNQSEHSPRPLSSVDEAIILTKEDSGIIWGSGAKAPTWEGYRVYRLRRARGGSDGGPCSGWSSGWNGCGDGGHWRYCGPSMAQPKKNKKQQSMHCTHHRSCLKVVYSVLFSKSNPQASKGRSSAR